MNFVRTISFICLTFWSLVGLSFDGHIMLSTDLPSSLGGISLNSEDIVEFDPISKKSTLLVRGNDIILDKKTEWDIDAFHMFADGSFVFSSANEITIAGKTFQHQDLFKYDPITQEVSLYFDGTVIKALNNQPAGIDAVHIQSDGTLILSVSHDISLDGLTFRDQDLFSYDPNTQVASLLLNGDKIVPNPEESVGINAVHVRRDGRIILSTNNTAQLGGIEVKASDVVEYIPSKDQARQLLSGLDYLPNENINALYYHGFIEEEVTTKVEIQQSRVQYNRRTASSSMDVAISNTGFDSLISHFKLVINTKDADVKVMNADGITLDGYPYFEFVAISNALARSEKTQNIKVIFSNPRRKRFNPELQVYSLLSEVGISQIESDVDGDGIHNHIDEFPYSPHPEGLDYTPDSYVEIIDRSDQRVKVLADKSLLGTNELVGVKIEQLHWGQNNVLKLNFGPSGRKFTKPLLVEVDLSGTPQADLPNVAQSFVVENISKQGQQYEIYQPFYNANTQRLSFWVPHFSVSVLLTRPSSMPPVDILIGGTQIEKFQPIVTKTQDKTAEIKNKYKALAGVNICKDTNNFSEDELLKDLAKAVMSAASEAVLNTIKKTKEKPLEFKLGAFSNLNADGTLEFSVMKNAPSSLKNMDIITADNSLTLDLGDNVVNLMESITTFFNATLSAKVISAVTGVQVMPNGLESILEVGHKNFYSDTWQLTARKMGGIGKNDQYFINSGAITFSLEGSVGLTIGEGSQGCKKTLKLEPSKPEFKPTMGIKLYTPLPYSVYDIQVTDIEGNTVENLGHLAFDEKAVLLVKHTSPQITAKHSGHGLFEKVSDPVKLENFQGYETRYMFTAPPSNHPDAKLVFSDELFSTKYPGYTLDIPLVQSCVDRDPLNPRVLHSVFDGDFTVSTLDQLMELASYDIVDGDVFIDQTDLESIEIPMCLQKITGTLFILENPNLKSISGLSLLSTVEGHIYIYDNDSLENLKGLEGLVTLNSGISIGNNKLLVDLSGLESLRRIESDLYIWGNDNLQALTGLEHLEYIGDCLCIGSWSDDGQYHGNPSLVSLSGLDSLREVGEAVKISDNYSLPSLVGLGRLEIIGDDLLIYENDNLESFTGLFSLKEIRGDLRIGENHILKNIDGLRTVKTIAENIFIEDNPELDNIDGLKNIEETWADYVKIDNNDSLRHIDGLSWLQETGNSLQITDNENLRSIEGLSSLEVVGGSLSIGGSSLSIGEPDHWYWPDSFRPGNASLKYLTGLGNLTRVENFFWISDNRSLVNLDALESLTYIGGTLLIGHDFDNSLGNDQLQNINGLANLTSLGSLIIAGNASLVEIDGFDSLFSIGYRGDYIRGLQIMENSALNSINGFSYLNRAEYLEIRGNGSLSTISGFPQLIINSGPYIANNDSLETIDGFNSYPGGTTARLSLSGNISLTDFSGFSQIKTLNYLSIRGNNSIENLLGLTALKRVERISITENNSLESFEGLSSLEDRTKRFYIRDNAKLDDIDDLSSLRVDKLFITNNPLLSICDDDLKEFSKNGFTFNELENENNKDCM